MQRLRKYKDNNEYVSHQLEKTLDKKVISSHKKGRANKVEEFTHRFKVISDIPKDIPILCIGSRYGEEIEALNDLGFTNVTGIDLVSFPPYTKKMDMHNLEFEDDSFNFIYTNSLDHSNDIEKSIKEMVRTIKSDGTIMIDIELYNTSGDYETVGFQSIHDIKDIFDSLGIKYGFRDVQYVRYLNDGESTFSFCVFNHKHTLMFYFQDKEDKYELNK